MLLIKFYVTGTHLYYQRCIAVHDSLVFVRNIDSYSLWLAPAVASMISCALFKNRLRGSKPLAFVWKTSQYGTIGLLNGHVYLRSKINVILAMGNIIVALRRKAEVPCGIMVIAVGF